MWYSQYETSDTKPNRVFVFGVESLLEQEVYPACTEEDLMPSECEVSPELESAIMLEETVHEQ